MKLMIRSGPEDLGHTSGSADQTLRINRAQARLQWWRKSSCSGSGKEAATDVMQAALCCSGMGNGGLPVSFALLSVRAIPYNARFLQSVTQSAPSGGDCSVEDPDGDERGRWCRTVHS
jgi:hypothetical protein